ncbi:MAG: L,D-transpeptidase [Myxococcaceae bacterium]
METGQEWDEEELPLAALAPPGPSAFGPEVGSLRVKRSIAVRAAPDDGSDILGTVAQDMRVAWARVEPGPGCERWVEILPRGWVCDRHLEANTRGPLAVELPKLQPGQFVPAQYGSIVGSRTRLYRGFDDLRQKRGPRVGRQTLMLKLKAELLVGRRQYWRTGRGQLVEASKVQVRKLSEFSGIELTGPDAPLLPIAWVSSRSAPEEGVPVWLTSKLRDEVGFLPPRSIVSPLGISRDGRAVHLGHYQWARREDLHVAEVTQPPPGVTEGDRWVDVNLAEQVLVAYQGARPVFATLVSTGRTNPTPVGVFRVWIKFAEAEMRGESNGRPYLVDAVPWTVYFFKDFALHTAYWHDHFGEPRSHGCVNLSPRDARWLYFWTSPGVPEGWSMVYASAAEPGSWVRIRTGREPEPEARVVACRFKEK